MNTIRIFRIAKRDANQQIAIVAKRHLIVFITVVLSFICIQSVPARKILVETGFENYVQPHEESPFQLSTKPVKNGRKSLEIFSEMKDRLHKSRHDFETDEPIVSVEFWVYVEKGEQSFGINLNTAESHVDHNLRGPYLEWYDGDIRYHIDRGDPWHEIAAYPINRWHYVRIVADFEKESFDFYMGKSREAALASRPKRNLEFQNPAAAPQPKRFSIWAWAMTARGYMDDLVIYEGDTAITLAVEPTAKLSTLWGRLKSK